MAKVSIKVNGKKIVKEVSDNTLLSDFVREKRVKEVTSNFLNKYIYSTLGILILLLVVIIYFVSR